MAMPNFTYVRPKSLADAVGHLRSPKARIHAGGTDLMGCLRDEVFGAEKLVSIGHLDKLKGIVRTPDGGMRIGALTSIAELAASGLIQQSYPALARGAAEVGSPQLRNQGTLGGNLCQKPRCWYYRGDFVCLRKGGNRCYAYDGENQYHCILGGSVCFITHPSDTAPALVAYEAVIRVAGPRGSERCRSKNSISSRGKMWKKKPSWRRTKSSRRSFCRPPARDHAALTGRCGPAAPGILPWPAWRWL